MLIQCFAFHDPGARRRFFFVVNDPAYTTTIRSCFAAANFAWLVAITSVRPLVRSRNCYGVLPLVHTVQLQMFRMLRHTPRCCNGTFGPIAAIGRTAKPSMRLAATHDTNHNFGTEHAMHYSSPPESLLNDWRRHATNSSFLNLATRSLSANMSFVPCVGSP